MSNLRETEEEEKRRKFLAWFFAQKSGDSTTGSRTYDEVIALVGQEGKKVSQLPKPLFPTLLGMTKEGWLSVGHRDGETYYQYSKKTRQSFGRDLSLVPQGYLT
jgi:hypothetical protein